MSIIQLSPKPGQASSLGNGQVFFSSPSAPTVAQNDPWMLFVVGEVPNLIEIGHMMPWESALTYDGSEDSNGNPIFGTDASGNMTIQGVCQISGSHSITDGNGIVLATGVLPGGRINIMGFRPCQYGPTVPPPPAPTPGLALLVATVEESWQNHIPVANWRTDGATVMYQSQPPYLAAPIVVTVPFMYCLSDAKAAAIAALLGGTVQKLPPTGYYSDLFGINPITNRIDGTLPAVNWIFATINGAPMKALAMALVQAFDSMAGNLQAAILATFQPA